MGTCLPAVTEALAATPGVASGAGKIPPFRQIPQSASDLLYMGNRGGVVKREPMPLGLYQIFFLKR